MSDDNRRLLSRGDYVSMSAEELEEWNRERIKNLRPLRPGHWSHKAAQRRRLVEAALYHRQEHYRYKEKLKITAQNLNQSQEMVAGLRQEIDDLKKEIERANRRPLYLG